MESTFQKKETCLLLKKNSLDLVENYEKHTVYTDGGTWYPEACNVLKLKHYLHSPFQKVDGKSQLQYFEDRTESFDDYYPCMQDECNLFHAYNWIQFFVSMYNDTTFDNYFINEMNKEAEYILN